MRALVLLPLFAVAAFSQVPSLPVEVANLREDVRGLVEQVGRLTMRVEELERQNAALQDRVEATQRSAASPAELAEAVARLEQAMRAGDSATQERAAAQIKRLAEQTNAAIDSLAKGMATRQPVQTSFSEDFPKEGVSYTVQKGDTLAIIARKTGARVQDIINANKIADPSKIQAGQTLFIPGGK